MDATIIRKRYNFEVEYRKTLENTFQVIEKMVVPFRGEFFKPMNVEHEVDWRRREIFDSTAIDSCQTLAASMQGSLTSPSVKWFALQFRKQVLKQSNAASRWLEDCDDIVYDTLQDSNFNVEASEFYLDMSSYGSGIIVEDGKGEDYESNWQGIEFNASPIVDSYFEEDDEGQVYNFYRRLKWTPIQIMSRFGENKCPQWVIDGSNKNPNEKVELIYCIYTRPENKDADISGALPVEQRPFGCKFVFHKDAAQIGPTGGKYEMPAFVGRWKKVSGSKWGHSPAFVCLSDILTLNELTEQTLEALGKVVDPSTIVTQRGLLSDLDLGRGGLTVAKSKEDIWAYESKARFDVGELKIERLQASIRRAFFVDQLELKDSPAMTATEAQIRYELMQRLLGPTLGRLQSDFLDPMISRTFNILARAGKLPEPPQIVLDEESEYDVMYTGPLARAQRSQTVQSIQQYMGNIAMMAELFPEVRDIPDVDTMTREIARLNGVPARMNKDENVVKKNRADRKKKEDAAIANELVKGKGEAQEALGKGRAELRSVGGKVE